MVLTEGDEKIGERLFGDVAGANGFGESHEDGMADFAVVAGVEFGAPEIEEGEGGLGVADFIPQIIRHAAVSVDGVEVGPKALGQEPGSDVEIFIMGFREAAAPGTRFFEGGGLVGNAVIGRKSGPAFFE